MILNKEITMKAYEVDDDVLAMVWSMSKPKPFEKLDFNSALKRILIEVSDGEKLRPSDLNDIDPDHLLAELESIGKLGNVKNYNIKKNSRRKSPSVKEWLRAVSKVDDAFKNNTKIKFWEDVCDALKIETYGASARLVLEKWVERNKPNWPAIPKP